MAMNPRLLRPKASGTSVPQFSPLGYTRLWGLSTDTTGNISGTASSDTGLYAVKWGGGDTRVYESGDGFSEALFDSSPNGLTVAARGNARISAAQSKFGGASLFLNGSSHASVSQQIDFAASDFTVEGWVRPASGGDQYQNVFSQRQAATAASVCVLRQGNDLTGYVSLSAGTWTVVLAASSALTDNEWTHFSLVRSGSSFSFYIDGVLASTGTASGAVTAATGGCAIGAANDADTAERFSGYIDDFRIVKGAAVYTSNFTPPTSPLTAIAGTSLLLHCDTQSKNQRAFEIYPCVQQETSLLLNFNGTNGSTVFTDSSPNGLTVTANGDAEISTAQSKFGGASLNPDGGYLTVGSASGFEFGTLDFTVEAWVYPPSGQNASLGTIATTAYPVDTNGIYIGVQDNTSIQWLLGDGTGPVGGWFFSKVVAGVLSADQWNHIAIVRKSQTVALYVNGVNVSQETGFSQSLPNVNGQIAIGGRSNLGQFFNGYIDDLRITKGAALYTSNFTPPTAQLAAIPSGVVPSGQFDGFDVSDNALTQLRAEDVSLSSSAGYTAPGYSLPQWQTSNGGWAGGTWVPGGYVPGVAENGDLSDNDLSTAALDQFYTDLDSGTGSLFVQGNPGIDADDPTIATAKGYTVFGSVLPETVLLLNFNGTNGSTSLADSSPNEFAVTAVGNAALSTSQAKYGSASLALDGFGSRATIASSAAFGLGTGDFTIEAWVWLNSTNANNAIVDLGGYQNGVLLRLDGGANDAAYIAGTAINWTAAGSFATEQWTHIAMTRQGTTVRFFVDGTQVHSTTNSNDAGSSASVMIGQASHSVNETFGPDDSFDGYIDDLRIVKGAALYTANFTPPTSQLGVYP